MTATPFTIDDEFKSLLPPLTDDEFGRLRDEINRHGCRDKLIVWKEWNILIDGHNRYEICTVLDLPFETTELSFKGREDVILWIIRNQLSRRNLTDFQRAEIALKLKPAIEKTAKANLATKARNQPLTNLSKAEQPINTRAEVAKIAGVSEGTVAKVEKIIEKATPDVVDRARNKAISIDAAHKTVNQPRARRESVVSDKGLEGAHEAIAVLRRISLNDKFRARAWEIVAAFIEANPVNGDPPADPGWVEMKSKTLKKVGRYAFRNRTACGVIEQDLTELLKLVKGYRKNTSYSGTQPTVASEDEVPQ